MDFFFEKMKGKEPKTINLNTKITSSMNDKLDEMAEFFKITKTEVVRASIEGTIEMFDKQKKDLQANKE